MKKKVYIAADHAGFKLKEQVKTQLIKSGLAVVDLGAKKYNKNDDYPDFALKLAKSVAKNKGDGILVCGSSFGVCLVANKVKDVRAVSVTNVADAKITRQHNNANVLCLSGWNMSLKKSMSLVKAFLNTDFSSETRHIRRLKKISQFEKKNFK